MEESIMPLKKDAKLPLKGQVVDMGQIFEDLKLYIGDKLIIRRDYSIEVVRDGYVKRRASLWDVAVRAEVIERPSYKKKESEMEIEEDLEMK